MQLVALLDDRRAAGRDRAVAAHDHVQQRLARQPELAHRMAVDRVALAHGELHRLRAEAVQQHGLDQRRRDRGLVAWSRRASAPRARSSGPAGSSRAARRRTRPGRSARRARRPSSPGRWRTRSGSRRAGPPSRASAARARVNPCATSSAASGRAITAVTIAIAVPSGMMSIRSPGFTSRPSSRKSPSWATQARPSWKVMIVRRAGEVALPITRPRDEDGEEAGAVERVGAAVGHAGERDRGDRVQAGRRQRHALEHDHAEAADGEPDRGRDRQLGDGEPERVEQPEVGVVDGLDAGQHEQHGDRVVDAGLALERRARSCAAASIRAARRTRRRRRSRPRSSRGSAPRAWRAR